MHYIKYSLLLLISLNNISSPAEQWPSAEATRHLLSIGKGIAIGAVCGKAANHLMHMRAQKQYPDLYNGYDATQRHQWAWQASPLTGFACACSTGIFTHMLSTPKDQPLLLFYYSAALGYALGAKFFRHDIKPNGHMICITVMGAYAFCASRIYWHGDQKNVDIRPLLNCGAVSI